MLGVRILRNVKLLGSDRRFGDELTPEQFASIPDPVSSALLSTGTVELILSEAEKQASDGQHLSARLDALSEQIKAQDARIEAQEAEIASLKSRRRGRPRKEG